MIGSIEAKSHREARRLFINRLVMKIRKKEKGTMKQLLIVIEGKDCEECERHERECSHEGCEYECKFCNDKSKFPTKLIFNAEEFKVKMLRCICGHSQNKHHEGRKIKYYENSPCFVKNCECDLWRWDKILYLLPKKGDKICAKCSRLLVGDKVLFFHKDTTQEDCLGFAKPFRLSSDAVLKSVGEYVKEEKTFMGQTKRFIAFLDDNKNFNKESKIVIAEVYYV